MRSALLALLALALAACSPTTIVSGAIKQPIVDKCTALELKSCDALADGAIEYIAGDRAAGRVKLEGAAADNEPGPMRDLARTVEALTSLPGMGSYAATVHDVAKLLAGSETVIAPAAVTAAEAPRGASPSVRPPVDLMRTATAAPLDDPRAAHCSVGDAPAVCLRVALGPLVVTDVYAAPGCGSALFVESRNANASTWYVGAPPGTGIGVHGAALLVADGDALFVGAVDPRPKKGAACPVTWSGWRPAN